MVVGVVGGDMLEVEGREYAYGVGSRVFGVPHFALGRRRNLDLWLLSFVVLLHRILNISMVLKTRHFADLVAKMKDHVYKISRIGGQKKHKKPEPKVGVLDLA